MIVLGESPRALPHVAEQLTSTQQLLNPSLRQPTFREKQSDALCLPVPSTNTARSLSLILP